VRLYPPVTVEEALEWLKRQAQQEWDAGPTPQLEESLRPLAEAMATVSAIVLPEEIEPFLL
jgi:hypothetical protein